MYALIIIIIIITIAVRVTYQMFDYSVPDLVGRMLQ
jgi:hypothetical protein